MQRKWPRRLMTRLLMNSLVVGGEVTKLCFWLLSLGARTPNLFL